MTREQLATELREEALRGYLHSSLFLQASPTSAARRQFANVLSDEELIASCIMVETGLEGEAAAPFFLLIANANNAEEFRGWCTV